MLTINMNGFQFAYERIGHVDKTPLLLIHGYPLDHTIWSSIVPLLENDFDLVLPDLRGFGGSSSPGIVYQLADLVTDLVSLLDFLKIDKTVLVGHSMGGYLGLAFAHRYPARMLGLGLIASQANADTPEKKTSRYLMADRVESDGVGEVAETMPALLTDARELQIILKSLIQLQRPEGVAGALRAIADRSDSSDFLHTFDFPIAIIHGLRDRIIPIDRAREILTAVQHGSLLEIKDTGHMPMLESPQLTAQALGFLK
jgi:3-oxoadipate enol-lactonase